MFCGQCQVLYPARHYNALIRLPTTYITDNQRLDDGKMMEIQAKPSKSSAIRELEEETGIAITGKAETLSKSHHATSTCFPNNHAIRLICRAVTPPGYIRRFDTRFFLVDAGMVNISGTTQETSHASDELEDLHWAPLSSVRAYNIAFITRRIISLAVNNLAGCQVAQYHHVEAGLPMVADLQYPGSHQRFQ